MKFIQKNIGYVASFIFAVMGVCLTLKLNSIWPFGFTILLNIFILTFDYLQAVIILERENNQEENIDDKTKK